ncbi:MAG: hypothetical protein LWW85_01615 [Marinilabiliales bacterium]|nr:hypothetical protein [Marinilabiliales bacterium]
MNYSNKKRLSRIKTLHLTGGLLLLAGMAVAVYLDWFQLVLYLGLTLIAGSILSLFLNFSFIRLLEEKERIIIRYYPLFSFEREYRSIEFPISALKSVKIRKYLFGIRWDLYIAVRMKHGIALYPPVSLTGVSMRERRQIAAWLESKTMA